MELVEVVLYVTDMERATRLYSDVAGADAERARLIAAGST